MHPTDRDELKHFIAPYLAMDAGAEEWRGGYFRVTEGPAFRGSKERVASIRWEKKNGSGPREVRDVLQALEEAVDLITMEPHDRVWIAAVVKGSNNPTSWLSVAVADGMGEGHHSSEMERALTTRMSKGAGGGNGDITAIALARMGMGAQAAMQEVNDKYIAAVEQLAVTTAENRNLQMLLEGALSIGGADRNERLFELLQAFAPHIGPVAGQALSALLQSQGIGAAAAAPSSETPQEPGPRIGHHIATIKSHMEQLVQTITSEPGAVTPEHETELRQLVATVQQWAAAMGINTSQG